MMVVAPAVSYEELSDQEKIAWQWLDAQRKTAGPTRISHPVKHLIEQWAGCSIGQRDVEKAALAHPAIRGKYPWFNIRGALTEPDTARLLLIKSAGETPGLREVHNVRNYAHRE